MLDQLRKRSQLLLLHQLKLIYEKYTLVKQLDTLAPLTQLGIKIGGYIHETQKERGATAGFLGSGESKFKKMLDDQRLQTDQKKEQLNAYLGALETDGYGQEFQNMLKQ